VSVCQAGGKCGLTLMRVVVVGSYARSLINFRGQLLQDMVNNGHEVIACAPQSPQHVVNALAEIGVSHEDIFLERTGTNPVSDLRALIGLKRLFARCRPDVVLLYTIKASNLWFPGCKIWSGAQCFFDDYWCGICFWRFITKAKVYENNDSTNVLGSSKK